MIFWACESGERQGRYREGPEGLDSILFDCTSHEKATHGHVVHGAHEGVKPAPKGVENGSRCPKNER